MASSSMLNVLSYIYTARPFCWCVRFVPLLFYNRTLMGLDCLNASHPVEVF